MKQKKFPEELIVNAGNRTCVWRIDQKIYLGVIDDQAGSAAKYRLHIYTSLSEILMKTKIILVFIKPEDEIKNISRNVVSFVQYYAAS